DRAVIHRSKEMTLAVGGYLVEMVQLRQASQIRAEVGRKGRGIGGIDLADVSVSGKGQRVGGRVKNDFRCPGQRADEARRRETAQIDRAELAVALLVARGVVSVAAAVESNLSDVYIIASDYVRRAVAERIERHASHRPRQTGRVCRFSVRRERQM